MTSGLVQAHKRHTTTKDDFKSVKSRTQMFYTSGCADEDFDAEQSYD